ncbi:hypothetical protein C8J55DRAFT_601226 [Lentinula edodes]|uniref:Uncharacterized protein n=1 Tax=Lentinula lateritia TaxID=40482 RepID=A0A9W9B1D4_9AGAR|nr:hypothetical protein C8J55DRAFT_601226 [Lentinula edodes]
MASNVGFPLQQSITACIYQNATSRPPLEIDYDALQISPWNYAEYHAGLAKVSAAIAKILKTERYGKINSTQFLAVSASIARSNSTIHRRFKFKSNHIEKCPDTKRPSPGYLLLCAVGRGDVDFDDEFINEAWSPLLDGLVDISQAWESFERKLKEKRTSTCGSPRILGDVTNFTPVAERNTTAAIAKRRTVSMDEFLKSPSKKYKSVPASSDSFSKIRSQNQAGARHEEPHGDPSACPDVLKICVPQPTRPLDVLPQDLDSTPTRTTVPVTLKTTSPLTSHDNCSSNSLLNIAIS